VSEAFRANVSPGWPGGSSAPIKRVGLRREVEDAVHLAGRLGVQGHQLPLEDQRPHPAEHLAGPVPVGDVLEEREHAEHVVTARLAELADRVPHKGRGAFVAGPDTGPVPTMMSAGTVVLGVRFRPSAGGPALGIPLSELRDQRVDLADLRPAEARRLTATLDPDTAAARAVDVTAALLAEGAPDPAVTRAACCATRRPVRTTSRPRSGSACASCAAAATARSATARRRCSGCCGSAGSSPGSTPFRRA
jgi:hypothetical protein